MIKINYPNKKPSIKTENNKEYIFCFVRKRWFIITPEEWVRQNFLLYLNETLGYSLQLIAVEKQIALSELKKRFDIVIYKDSKPFMLVECKEMNVPLSDLIIAQVLRYNATIQAPYIVITNGSYCKGFLKDENSFLEIFELPNAE
jgi:hypothetical protein